MTTASQTTPAIPAGTTAPAPWLPVAAGGVTLVMWASAFVVIRHVAHDVSPGALGSGRLLVAALVVLPLVLRKGWVRPTPREWTLLAVGGVGWFGIYNLTLNAGERHVDAGTAAMIIQIGPVLVALLAVPLFGERLHGWLLGGMLVGFAGVAVIARGSSTEAGASVLGVVLVVVAAAMYAVGVLPTAVAFTTWAYALTHTDAGALSLTTFLVPGIATLVAWLTIDEVPPSLTFVGGALAIVGVLMTRRRPKQA